MRTGVFPGSFNPPTVAHLAVADEARVRCRLDRLDLVVSIDALGKHAGELAALEHRLAALRAMAAGRPWLDVRTTDARLLVDIAAGYQVVVMGADKWAQVVDPAWYGGTAGRDAALARLPEVAVAPRPPHALPPPRPGLVVLEVQVGHHEVSATAVRNGRAEWLAPGVGPEPWQAEERRQAPGGRSRQEDGA